MRQIRREVFETNSSSTHSVTVLHRGLANNDMPIDRDGYIHTQLGEFGWEFEDYHDQATKLSYLVTMMASKNGDFERFWNPDEDQIAKNIKTLMESREFEQLSDEIARHARCKGVIIDYSEGYIDHQSHEDYRTVQDFLDDYGMTAMEFIFGKGTVLHTGNDNC